MTFENWNLKSGIAVAYMCIYIFIFARYAIYKLVICYVQISDFCS